MPQRLQPLGVAARQTLTRGWAGHTAPLPGDRLPGSWLCGGRAVGEGGCRPPPPGAGEGWCWAPRAARALPHQTGHWGCLGYRHPFLALPSGVGPEQRRTEGQRPRVTAFLVLPTPEVFAGFHRWKRGLPTPVTTGGDRPAVCQDLPVCGHDTS